MKIIHGENTVKARERLMNWREETVRKGERWVVVDGRKADLEEVIQAVEGGELFGGGRVVVIENLLRANESKRKQAIVEYLKENKSEVVLWEEGKIDGRKYQGLIKSSEVVEEKIDTRIFGLVEAIRPKNERAAVGLLIEVGKTEAAELIMFMMLRQIRMLIQVETDEATFKGPGWLKNKLVTQAKMWGEAGLLRLHDQLYEIDKRVKTGQTPLNLMAELEWWLMRL